MSYCYIHRIALLSEELDLNSIVLYHPVRSCIDGDSVLVHLLFVQNLASQVAKLISL
jgi:hypothetical protein